MPDTCNYPAEIERDEDGRYVVTFPDFGWGATDGATRDEALAEAKDLLRELIATTIREGEDLPDPSRASNRRPLVVPPVQIALKAALYEAWRQAGISQRRLARELGIAESEVRRILNPDHGTKAATIDRALRRLGKHVTVTRRRGSLIRSRGRSALVRRGTKSQSINGSAASAAPDHQPDRPNASCTGAGGGPAESLEGLDHRGEPRADRDSRPATSSRR